MRAFSPSQKSVDTFLGWSPQCYISHGLVAPMVLGGCSWLPALGASEVSLKILGWRLFQLISFLDAWYVVIFIHKGIHLPRALAAFAFI